MYLQETRSIVSRSAARSLVGREMDRFTTPTDLHVAASSRRSRLLRDECRFTLRGNLLLIAIVGVSFCVSFQLNPLWGALLLAYTFIAYCYWRSAIRKAVWLPLAIVALHTILYSIAAVIDYADAWDDMSPTMLVTLAMFLFDYPVHAVYRYLGLFPTNEPDHLWYAAQLVLIGGTLWLVFGWILQVLGSSLAGVVRSTHAWFRREPAGDEQPISSK